MVPGVSERALFCAQGRALGDEASRTSSTENYSARTERIGRFLPGGRQASLLSFVRVDFVPNSLFSLLMQDVREGLFLPVTSYN